MDADCQAFLQFATPNLKKMTLEINESIFGENKRN
jgi:hypothetical protein